MKSEEINYITMILFKKKKKMFKINKNNEFTNLKIHNIKIK